MYALDDTQGCSGGACTGNVGGKVVTTSDQIAAYPSGIVWSSKGTTGGGTGGFDPIDATYDIIPLIGDSVSGTNPPYSTALATYDATYPTYLITNPFPGLSSFASCSGALDGACNSSNILALYGIYTTDSHNNTVSTGATSTHSYAAGFCSGPIGSPSHSDWYLPAICEMGYYNPGVAGNDAGCGSSATPTLQNIQTSLIDLSSFTSPAGYYWSSTEFSGFPQDGAWGQYFASSGGSGQGFNGKYYQLGVRCSRALTI